MYAIRSYYGLDKLNLSLNYNDISGWNIEKCPIAPHDEWLCGESSDNPVITSYSIHYTKLYDIGGKLMIQDTIEKLDQNTIIYWIILSILCILGSALCLIFAILSLPFKLITPISFNHFPSYNFV